MIMSSISSLSKLISDVKEVGLHEVYVSIEEDKTSNFLQYCLETGVKCSLVDQSKWPCNTESYYIGDESEPKNLQLFSLKF